MGDVRPDDAVESHATSVLARFLVESRPEDIPAEVRHEAARAILNWTGCAVGGAGHETIDHTLAAFGPFGGPAQASLFGRSERTDALNAALINGISSHLLDFDDTHARAIHPSAPVLPALFAYSEWQAICGRDLVHAFVLGVEAECRVGLSVYPEHHDLGWHITGTAGVFGATAAIGKLIGLTTQQMTWALGIAAAQAAGLQVMFGSMCKSLHAGRAAQNGLSAALLAKQDFTSSERGIEGARGFGEVYSTRFDPSVITEGLGTRYELSLNMYKPYACGLVVHAVIDGCLALREQYGLQPEEIEAIELAVSPRTMELTSNKEPRTGLEGRFSVFHVAAAALIFGAVGEAQFTDASVLDARAVALRRRISTTVDPQLLRTQASVSMRLKDGRAVTHHVEHALGTLGRPMRDADLEAKFFGLTEETLGAEQARSLAGLCWSIETLTDAGALARMAARRA